MEASDLNKKSSMDEKFCKGILCKGKLRPLSSFYTKGKSRHGIERRDHICKECKLKLSELKRSKRKKAIREATEKKKLDPYCCQIIVNFENDHLKYDLERFLKSIAYDLITE